MSRYQEAYANPQGVGDARPTAIQIIKDEEMEGKLHGKVIVITGTSAGIGIETARALSLTGARLFLLARDLKKATTALEGILEPGRVELVEMDNLSLDSVGEAAAEILSRSNNKVNILINNAGIMAVPDLRHTKDGNEMQFGVNHLAHFLLYKLLEAALLANATSEFSSRVVNVSSSGHIAQSINDSNNYNFEKGGYSEWGAYGQSKTANIYMSNAIERYHGSKGLRATSLHPGGIMTNLAQFMAPEALKAFDTPEITRYLRSPEQGAATTVWAAIGKEWESRGRYLADCAESGPIKEGDGPLFSTTGYAPFAYDVEREDRLWKDSLRLVGLTE